MSSIERHPLVLPLPMPLPLSRVVRAGDFLFLSGQIPLDSDGQLVRGDIRSQTDAAIERIKDSLALVGASLKDVVRVTVWLSDMTLFPGFNETYASHFQSDFPTRSTVQAKLALDVDVEIEVQAWVGGKV